MRLAWSTSRSTRSTDPLEARKTHGLCAPRCRFHRLVEGGTGQVRAWSGSGEPGGASRSRLPDHVTCAGRYGKWPTNILGASEVLGMCP
jgi:hypothetical protein